MSASHIKIKRTFLGAISVFLILLPAFLSAQTVFFEPQNINVNQNTQFSLPLKINDVNNLFGVNFDLNFDPNLLEYVSTQEGDFLKQGCNTVLMANSNTPGKLIFGLTRLGAGCSGVSGSGLIATINFRSKGVNDVATLAFSNNSLCILSGSSCNYITGTWNSATVTIGNPDTTPPVISNGSPEGDLPAGTTQTIMSVTTNENATCRYSTTTGTAYSSMTNAFSTTGGTSHSTIITDLVNGQTYNRYIRCQDAAGNANPSDYNITFSVASPDATAPIISSVIASAVTASGATIAWTTNELSDSQVEYGLTASYGSQTTLNTSLVNSHSQTLIGLSANTTYHYRVKSRDAAGNLASSEDYTFTTTAIPDTTPPTISAVSASSITSNSATIVWTTNEASDSQVEYGLSSSYGNQTNLDSSLVTTHGIIINGLNAGTLYHFRVRSKDSNANLATSSDYTFSTLSVQSICPPAGGPGGRPR